MSGVKDASGNTIKVEWAPRPAHAISPARLAMGLLFLMIALAAVVGVVATLLMGQPTMAIVIALISSAFFIVHATC
jgi:hypothetical protein